MSSFGIDNTLGRIHDLGGARELTEARGPGSPSSASPSQGEPWPVQSPVQSFEQILHAHEGKPAGHGEGFGKAAGPSHHAGLHHGSHHHADLHHVPGQHAGMQSAPVPIAATPVLDGTGSTGPAEDAKVAVKPRENHPREGGGAGGGIDKQNGDRSYMEWAAMQSPAY